MEYILITGGLGYVGSHVAVELLRASYNVIIADNCSNSDITVFDTIKAAANCDDNRLIFHRADTRKGEELATIFTAHKIVTVIHLAGTSCAHTTQPLYHFSNNVSGTITLLGAMKHFRCRHLIYGSSAAVYGNALSPLCEQDMVGRGQLTAYNRSIVMTEQILQEQAATDPDWTICVLRLFNVCGSVLPTLPRNIYGIIYRLGTGLPVSIYGSEHATIDGTCVRDYIHVSDIAGAFIRALKVVRGFNIYNIGSGIGTSMLELIDCFSKVNCVNITWAFDEPRSHDIPMLYACIGKAFRDLGWKPLKTINDICVSELA